MKIRFCDAGSVLRHVPNPPMQYPASVSRARCRVTNVLPT